MDNHGVPDRVHLSEATYRQIHQHYNCESRGRLDIKGKGAMETYLVGH
jgi:class 3 adenylate cyclase